MTDTPTKDVHEALRELRARDQWVAYTASKIPISPSGNAASSTDPSTWGSLDAAKVVRAMQGLPGVGYVLSADDPFVCVDIDNGIDAASGELKPWAARIVRGLDSYTERSPGGLGVHIWLRATTPRPGLKRLVEDGAVEVYAYRRYITMTGEHWEGTPRGIEERQEPVNRLWGWLDKAALEEDVEARTRPAPAGWEPPEDDQWVSDALRYIPADDYETWIRVGMALQSHFGERGWPMWNAWSSTSAKYDGTRRARRKWDQLNADGSVQIGTVAWMAERRGWEMPRDQAPEAFRKGWDAWFEENANPVQDGESRLEGLVPVWFDLAAAYVDDSPVDPYLVEPRILGRGDMMILAGPPKAGKSLVCLDMCRQFAMGERWLFMEPTRELRIAYMQFELRADAMRERIQLREMSTGELDRLRGNFWFTSRMTAALTPAFVTMCVESIRDTLPAPPDLLVIDPLANLFAGDNESSNAEMMEFVRNLKVLRNQIDPDCGIILVHHSRKGGSGRRNMDADPFDSIRGGSALRGAYDTGLSLEKTGQRRDDPIRVHLELRNGPGRDPLELSFAAGRWHDASDSRMTLEEFVEVEEETGAAIIDGRPARPVEHQEYEQAVRDEAIEGRIYTESAFARALDGRSDFGSESTIRRKIKVLLQQGWIAYRRVIGDRVAPTKSPGFLVVRNMPTLDPETGEVTYPLPDAARDPETEQVMEVDGWDGIRPVVI